MTRQFDNQPRDDSRPPSHRIPSSRYAEQQSARPARPRLNRAMVDRGWENGSPRHHADYHPRVSNGQAPQNNWRKNQEAGDSSYNGPAGNRTNGNHRAQRIASSFQTPSAPRKRPFESKGYNAENRRFSNQYQESESYGSNNQRQPQGRGSDYHSQRRSNKYSNNGSQPSREYANGYGNNRSQRNPEWDKGKEHRSFNGRDQEQRQLHPRLQSRPEIYARRTEKAEGVQPQSRGPQPETYAGRTEKAEGVQPQSRGPQPETYAGRTEKAEGVQPQSREPRPETYAGRTEKAEGVQPQSRGPRPETYAGRTEKAEGVQPQSREPRPETYAGRTKKAEGVQPQSREPQT